MLGTTLPATLQAAPTTEISPPAGYTRLEQDNAVVTLTGNWYTQSAADHSGGSVVLSLDPAARASLSFTGTRVRWIGFSDQWSGIADIYLDGTFLQSVDTYAPSSVPQALEFSLTDLPAGPHVLAIVPENACDAASGGNWIWVDAFDIPFDDPPTTRVEQDNPAVSYTGTWYTQTAADHSGGSAVLSQDPSAQATLSFSGTGVNWIGYSDPWSGIANVYLDGVFQQSVDTYASTTVPQVSLFSVSGLAAGTHSLAIRPTGTENPTSQGSWIWVDAFDIMGSSDPPPPPPPPPPSSGGAVLTYHNDNARTGQYLDETVLTPANVNASNFGKIGFYPVDGSVQAQPLFLPGLTIGGASHNVLYVATEHDSLYAFDADTGAVLWQAALAATGETPSDDRGCFQITPEIGITATPVIDPTAGTDGAIFAVAMSKDAAGNYHQRLHALDVVTGSELSGSPVEIQASYPGTGDGSVNGNVIFDPKQYKERAGLLLLNGTVYTFWSSHCDDLPYTGWIIGYDESTLRQVRALDITPNGNGGSIWASGAAPAADALGNIYLLVSNGTFDTTLDASGMPSQGDYGNAFLKLSSGIGVMTVADYFNMSNTVQESAADQDLSSGGVLLLPDVTDASGTTRHLAVGAGKDANIYVVDRDNLGKFDPAANHVYQELSGSLAGGVYGMPAYFNGSVYFGPVKDVLRAYSLSGSGLSTAPTSVSTHTFGYPGPTPSISANGSADGIVWGVEDSSLGGLYAYDAANLGNELYDSFQAPGGRDNFGPGNRFITPTIANGKVYVAATNGVAVFGLLHPGVTRLEQDNPAVAYAGSWITEPNAAFSLGTAAMSNTAGSTATLSFTGTSVTWVGYRGPDSAGIAEVSVDGGTPVQVDTYSPTATFQAPVFNSGPLAEGGHTLTITITGQYDRNGSSAYVVVDAFDSTP